MSSPTIAVILINWNGWEMTLNALRSLRCSERVAWHLFLVDNASSDQSALHLAQLGDDVTFVQSPVNSGWTGGNNLGLEYALRAGHDHFFIMNNDAEVLPDTLYQLQTAFDDQRDNLPVLGPVHLRPDRSVYDFVGTDHDPVTGLTRARDPRQYAVGSLPASLPSAYIRGAGLFIHRQHIEAIGKFDERFFLNYDETDWCFRAAKRGYPILMLGKALITHIVSGSIGGGASPLNNYFMTRNALLFAEKHCTLKQRLMVFRERYWFARWQSNNSKRMGAISELVFGRKESSITFRLALRDYVFRRFGDCPLRVRRLQNGW